MPARQLTTPAHSRLPALRKPHDLIARRGAQRLGATSELPKPELEARCPTPEPPFLTVGVHSPGTVGRVTVTAETWATADNNKNMKDKREQEGEAGKRVSFNPLGQHPFTSHPFLGPKESMGTGSRVPFASSLRFSKVSSLLDTHWAWRGAR